MSNWNSFPHWSVKIVERLIKGRACFQKSCIFHLNQIMSSWFLPLGQSLSQLVINNLTTHHAYVFILCCPQMHSVRLLTYLLSSEHFGTDTESQPIRKQRLCSRIYTNRVQIWIEWLSEHFETPKSKWAFKKLSSYALKIHLLMTPFWILLSNLATLIWPITISLIFFPSPCLSDKLKTERLECCHVYFMLWNPGFLAIKLNDQFLIPSLRKQTYM